MPYIKKLVGLLLLLLLLLLFPIALTLFQISTIFNTQNIVNQIDAANTYSFLDEELFPLIAKEIFKEWEQPWGMEIQETEILHAARRVAPPAWAQQQVEDIISQTLPFITGQEDEFFINVTFDTPIQEFLKILDQIGRQQAPTVYQHLFGQQIPDLVKTWLTSNEEFTFRKPLDSAQISRNLQALFPADWFHDELDESLDEIAPYILGQTDGFLVTITVNDTKPLIASSMIEGLLKNLNLQPIVIDQVVRPEIERIFSNFDVPSCLNTDRKQKNFCMPMDELVHVIEKTATEDWLDAELTLTYHDVAEYLVGRREHFAVSIPLEDFKSVALEVLIGPITKQPIGTADDQLSQSQRLFLMTDRVLLSAVVDTVFPDNVQITESTFKRFLDPKKLKILQDFQGGVNGGWAFSDDNLRQALATEPGALKFVDKLRLLGASGWEYSHDDLAAGLVSPENNSAVMRYIDKLRKGIELTTELLSLTIILMIIILLGIGLLAGQNGPHKLAWVSGTLGLVSLVTYGAAEFIYNGQIGPYLHDSFADTLVHEGAFSEIRSVVFDKVILESERMFREFASSVAKRSLMVFLIASGILLTALIWSRILKWGQGFKT